MTELEMRLQQEVVAQRREFERTLKELKDSYLNSLQTMKNSYHRSLDECMKKLQDSASVINRQSQLLRDMENELKQIKHPLRLEPDPDLEKLLHGIERQLIDLQKRLDAM